MNKKILTILAAIGLLLPLFFISDPSYAQNDFPGIIQDSTPPPSNRLLSTTHQLFLPAVSQAPSTLPVLGVEMSSISQGPLLDLATEAGIKWVRRNGVLWNEIEEVEGIRDWSSLAALEPEMVLLSERGMKLVLIVRGVPEWARAEGGHICGPIAPDKFSAFASFMNELVNRYSQPPYNVQYWEIGNEPDAPFISDTSPFGCWGDSGNRYYGGGKYGKMLEVIYPQIKAADPNAQVLIGGLLLDCDPINPPAGRTCTISKFLEGILQEGAGNSFDGVSFHSYDYYNGILGSYSNANWHGSSTTTGPILDLKAAFLKSVLERYGHPEKYLLMTETALLCNDQYQTCAEDYELTKAIYAVQNYTESLTSQLAASIWYSYTNPWRFTSLITSSTPKPAYYAYQVLNEHLLDTIYRGKIDIEGLAVYEFARNGDRLWVAWAVNEQGRTIRLPNAPAQMWDLFGNPIPVNNEINIGIQPVYLEWND